MDASVEVLARTQEFIIYGERADFGIILHGYVGVPWSRSVLKRMAAEIAELATKLPPLYAFQTASCDPRKRKFIQQVGGVFHHHRLTGDGEPAEMFWFPPLDPSKGIPDGKSIQIQDHQDQEPV